MAGLTPLPLYAFRRSLRARGSSVEKLAEAIECGRSHLSQVLWGERAGGETWARIRAVVTADEWALLLQMEHCATWNNAQIARGSEAFVWLMRAECATPTCRALLRFVKCTAAQAGEVSHGLCPACYSAAVEELNRIATAPAWQFMPADRRASA